MHLGLRSVAGAVLLATLAIVTGCSGDEPDETPLTDVDAAPEPQPEPEPDPEPGADEPDAEVVTTDLSGFEPRSVVFANVELSVTAAHVTNQDLRSYAEGSEPTVDAEGPFLVLDVRATNLLGSTQVDIGDAAFTLLVGESPTNLDQRVSFLSEVTGIIPANTSVESFLAFPVAEGADLTGAALVVGAPPDRAETLPLTDPVPEPDYPISAPLEGSAEGAGPTNGGAISFTLLEATLSEDVPHENATSPTGVRADEGELFLVLHVSAVKTAGRGNELLSEGIRLLVDGAPIAPWDLAIDPQGSDQSPTIEPGATSEFWAAFLLPVDTEELALQVGDVSEEPGVIPFTLPSPLY